MEQNKLKGGLADGKTLNDLCKKHKVSLELLQKQLQMGMKVEMEHTNDKKIAREVAMDHLYENPKYYSKLTKMEKEIDEMDSGSSGSFEAPMSTTESSTTTILKRDLYKPQEIDEVTAGVDGSYDAPFGTGSKNPLSIGGQKTIGKRAKTINKTKSFPKFGGPDAKFVTINPKCKKFPYCNQGDPKAISIHEEIEEVAKKYGIPVKELEKSIIKEIKEIFI